MQDKPSSDTSRSTLSASTASRYALPLLLIGMLVIGNIALFTALWLSTPALPKTKTPSKPAAMPQKPIASSDNTTPHALTRLEHEKANVLLLQAMLDHTNIVQSQLSIQKKTHYLAEASKLLTLSGDTYYIKQQQQLTQEITQLNTQLEPLLTQYTHKLEIFCQIPEKSRNAALWVAADTYTKSNPAEQAIFRQLHQDMQACSHPADISSEQIRKHLEQRYQPSSQLPYNKENP